MQRVPIALAAVLLVFCRSVWAQPAQAPAEWTVLLFMNGDNNLEPWALSDFYELASVGGTKDVNIVAQLDRNGKYTGSYNRWTDTRRFIVKKDRAPTPEESLQALGEVNMGDPKALEDFVRWGMQTYPARHYALIIWDHGQGYRDVSSMEGQGDFFRSAFGMPFRSVSHDDTDKDQLYNDEIRQALRAALAGRKLDLIGFDACLMGMLETAYAMREFADIMVASEDLEPGFGWAYDKWVAALVQRPKASAEEVARWIVKSYPLGYAPYLSRPDETMTLSAIRLSQIDALAGAVSVLSDAMLLSLGTEVGAIEAARHASPAFARDYPVKGDERFHHVDLKKFAAEYQLRTRNESIQKALAEVIALHQKAVIDAFAGRARASEGASGLAIYFPAGRRAYSTDAYEERGYEKNNEVYPVAFVREQKWADFLHAYFESVP